MSAADQPTQKCLKDIPGLLHMIIDTENVRAASRDRTDVIERLRSNAARSRCVYA